MVCSIPAQWGSGWDKRQNMNAGNKFNSTNFKATFFRGEVNNPWSTFLQFHLSGPHKSKQTIKDEPFIPNPRKGSHACTGGAGEDICDATRLIRPAEPSQFTAVINERGGGGGCCFVSVSAAGLCFQSATCVSPYEGILRAEECVNAPPRGAFTQGPYRQSATGSEKRGVLIRGRWSSLLGR